MKKIIILLLVFILLISTTATVFAGIEEKVPAKVKVIGQSGMSAGLSVTVIDLSNNEIVVLLYCVKPGFKPEFFLTDVERTGMFVDLNSQNSITGTDAPFGEDIRKE